MELEGEILFSCSPMVKGKGNGGMKLEEEEEKGLSVQNGRAFI